MPTRSPSATGKRYSPAPLWNKVNRACLMVTRYRIVVVLVAALFTLSPLALPSLSAQGRARPAAPAKPAPHFADGTPNLGITAEESGLWLPLDRTELGRRSTLAPVE